MILERDDAADLGGADWDDDDASWDMPQIATGEQDLEAQLQAAVGLGNDPGLELLVDLAKKGEADPWDLDVVSLTDRYLEALDEQLDARDLGRVARLIFYAACLIHLKAQAMAMSIAMEMRHVRADLMIARSVRTLLRANEFYHKLMVILIQDTKSGVEYNPNRIEALIPAEFSDMIDKSIMSTDLTGLLDSTWLDPCCGLAYGIESLFCL